MSYTRPPDAAGKRPSSVMTPFAHLKAPPIEAPTTTEPSGKSTPEVSGETRPESTGSGVGLCSIVMYHKLMKMALDPDSPVPLYHQITEALSYRIATGRIPAGQRLPSVREAAKAWDVNMHTVRRAYGELSQRGLAWIFA